MEMNILDYVLPDLQLKVGAKNGNGFFYCGTVADFKKNMDEYSEKCRDFVIQVLRNAQVRMIQAKHDAQTHPEKVDKKFEAELARLERSFEKARNAVTFFIPLDQRCVHDLFVADSVADEPDLLIMIVEGSERGAYWTMEEAIGKPYFATRTN